MDNHSPTPQPESEQTEPKTLTDDQIKTILEVLRQWRSNDQKPEYDDIAGS